MGATIFMIVMFSALAAVFAYEMGKHRGRIDSFPHIDRANRYQHAVDSVDMWCGHEFPQARLIAAHLMAEGEGLGMNAGTPMGDEPCTISGLREQLRRVAAEAK